MNYMNPMHQQHDEEALRALRKAGFTAVEIERLIQLRRDYGTSPLDQPALDYARLRFVRWLVTTGRLTDQLPEEAAPRKPDQVQQEDTSNKLDQTPLDSGTGKPTDQATQENASDISPSKKKPTLKTTTGLLNMKKLQHWLVPPSLVWYHFTLA